MTYPARTNQDCTRNSNHEGERCQTTPATRTDQGQAGPQGHWR